MELLASRDLFQAELSDEPYGMNFGENWISVDPSVDYDKTLDSVHRTVEGYPGLVVHGPLSATLLVDHLLRSRPGSAIDAVSNEKREEPSLQPECDATARRHLSGRQRDAERLAKELLVIVERRGGGAPLLADGKGELVLQRLYALDDRFPASGWREEGVGRDEKTGVQIEARSQRAGATHGALAELFHLRGGAHADDLAHRKRPLPLERRYVIIRID